MLATAAATRSARAVRPARPASPPSTTRPGSSTTQTGCDPDRDPVGEFGQNISAPDQVRALTAGLRAASADADPVIAIDEEGGDVIRVAYSDGSPYPGNAALGAVDDTGLTRSVYQAIGGDLAALGINFDLAPCADVLGSADSPAAGRFGWGQGPWAPPGSVRRVSASGGSLNGAGPRRWPRRD